MLIEQLSQWPLLWGGLLILLGLMMGSFLNVVILRLPQNLSQQWKAQCQALLASEQASDADIGSKNHQEIDEKTINIAYPPSHCPQCKAALKWWQNIPVLSYLLLKGKCHACKQSISIRYPLVEILTALLTLLAGLHFSDISVLPWVLLLVWSLIAMSFIDFDTQLLPDILTLPMMWLGLLFNTSNAGFTTPSHAIIGAAAGYLVLWLLYQAHYFITKREGMGYGDFKLLAVAGAWLGWQYLPFVLFLAAISGLFISLLLMLFKQHKSNVTIPFGPYLSIALFIMLFWGEAFIDRYMALLI